MIILAIDTSCDDTSVAILKNDCVLANVVSSQIDIHKEWGGVVPNLARREHEIRLNPCTDLACWRAGFKNGVEQVDALAVTYGPGLAPALQVGVKFAQELALKYRKPLLAVNHLEGHILSSLLKNSRGKYYGAVKKPKFPALAMVVSGGHTEIVWIESIGKYKILGQTLDDAAGEAFDKVARMLGLGYPGGAVVEKLAKRGDPQKYKLPRPMAQTKDFNFSFSGLKTACLYQTNDLKKSLGDDFFKIIPDYCASLQQAVIDTLRIKLVRAVVQYNTEAVLFGGGVVSNNKLRSELRRYFKKNTLNLFFPNKKFCMDNAAMIGMAAYQQTLRSKYVKDISVLDRRPSLTIESQNEFE